MMKFITDSIRELKHVVWPTKEETTRYFMIVVGILVLFWIYLFLFSTLFTNWLLWVKNIVNPSTQTTVTNQNPINLTPNSITTEVVSSGSTNESKTSTWTTSTGKTNEKTNSWAVSTGNTTESTNSWTVSTGSTQN